MNRKNKMMGEQKINSHTYTQSNWLFGIDQQMNQRKKGKKK